MNGNQTKTTKENIRVISMIGGIDIMGVIGDTPAAFVRLERPCILQMQPQNQLRITDMLKSSNVLEGTSIMVNMQAVLWMAEPSQTLALTYQAQCSGLLVPGAIPAAQDVALTKQ